MAVVNEGGRRPRKSFEKLVREVAAVLNDPQTRALTVQQVADRLDEHPWRVVDAIQAYSMMGGG